MSLQHLYSRVDALLARQHAATHATEIRVLGIKIAKLNKEIDRLV